MDKVFQLALNAVISYLESHPEVIEKLVVQGIEALIAKLQPAK